MGDLPSHERIEELMAEILATPTSRIAARARRWTAPELTLALHMASARLGAIQGAEGRLDRELQDKCTAIGAVVRVRLRGR